MRKITKINLRFLLDVYDAFLREPILNKVAQALEISEITLFDLARKNKYVKQAKELADSRRHKDHSFKEYILGNLSPEAKKVWEKIEFWAETESYGTPAVMRNAGKRLKQEIFLYALVSSNYDLSRACRLAGVSRGGLENWNNTDAEFRSLVQEVQWYKKNFFENALMDLVEQRYPGAVLFVNRTINADRGYSEKLQVEHTGFVGTGGIDLAELDLDLETKKKILEAIRRKKQKEKPSPQTEQNRFSTPLLDVGTVPNGEPHLEE